MEPIKTHIQHIIERVQRPEYTGENRCLPCTVTNLVIAAAISTFLSFVSVSGAILSFGVCSILIYLWGYLIPGTPQLTKRYLPDWMFAWFDHDQSSTPASLQERTDETFEPEAILREADIMVTCENQTDVCLVEGFRESWRERMESVDEAYAQEAIADALDVEANNLSYRHHGPAIIATNGDRTVGQWESSAARIADVATSDELAARYEGWEDLSVVERGRLLKVFRIFLERCPVCQGNISTTQETVESCCRSFDTIASTCNSCEARIMEQRLAE